MKNFKREGKVGEWAIYYRNPPYPSGYAKILEVYNNLGGNDLYPGGVSSPIIYKLDTHDVFRELWYSRYCATFETEDEAEKEYRDFRDNKNNYAYEG